MINKLVIIGVGLIGGSLARALRAKQAVKQIVGYGRNIKKLDKALALGVIDSATTDMQTAIMDADMVVVAVPVGSMENIFQQIYAVVQQGVSHDMVITDVGSTKKSVLAAIENVFQSVPDYFVPGHPIAGTENSGVAASFATLYEQHKVILTPCSTTSVNALQKTRAMWQIAGAQVLEMSAEHHDIVLAATSHLPHVLAYTLVNSLAQLNDKTEIFRYAAGGFLDFTRIASSDPQMWLDICLANRKALLKHIDHFQKDLNIFEMALENQDAETIQTIFQRAKNTRDSFSKTRSFT